MTASKKSKVTFRSGSKSVGGGHDRFHVVGSVEGRYVLEEYVKLTGGIVPVPFPAGVSPL